DGNLDILVAGNLYASEVETPRNDAGHGLFLEGNGKGKFTAIPPSDSGFFVSGDVKNMARIQLNSQPYIIAAKNNDYLQFIELKKKKGLSSE
uniref:hypothetical protein n=1 Tax=Zobellia laminariae TaxID=248906 RepID=UPI004056EF41